MRQMLTYFFFFNDTATTEIYTLSLHDALPIYQRALHFMTQHCRADVAVQRGLDRKPAFRAHPGDAVKTDGDRKSTRLNSSHSQISYAVFCLKKKKQNKRNNSQD